MNDSNTALKAALVVAALEYPISQYYKTVPPTNTIMRMAIAAAMAYAGVVVAQKFLTSSKTPPKMGSSSGSGSSGSW